MKLRKNIFSTNINILKFKQSLPILLILSLALMLCIYQIDKESLWIDEIFSIRDAGKISNLTFNRPLYFMLLHIWMYFGKNEAWLRSLSVIFGLGSVWLTYLLGYRLYSKEIGLIAALILALSPLTINHSQEVRMYMLSMFLGISGSLLLTHLIERPAILSIISWIIIRFLAILTTPINILLLLSDTLIIGWYLCKHPNWISKWRHKILWLIGVLIIPSIIAIKDIVPPLLKFFEEIEGLEHRVNIGIPAFVGGIARLTLWRLDSPLENLSWFYEHIFFNIYAFILLFLLVAIWLQKKNPIGIFWLTAWGFLPLVILFLLSQFYHVAWGVARYSIFTAPYIFILLAAGLVRTLRWRKIVGITIIGIYIIAIGGALINYYTVTYREDWRGVTQVIQVEAQPGDAIALFPDSRLPALNYYVEGNYSIYTLESLPKEKIFLPIDKLFLKQMFHDLLQIKSRFWLIFAYAHTGFNDDNQVLEEVINEQFEVLSHRSFKGIELFLINSSNDKYLHE